MQLLLIILGLLAACLFIFGGSYLMILGIKRIRLAHATKTWTKTWGKITQSRMETGTDSDGDPVYKPIIKYTYTVMGQEFQGNQVYFQVMKSITYSGNNLSFTEKMTNKYPPGKTVEVFYNPRKPQQAVLEPGVSLKSFSELTWGFGAFSVGAIGIIIAIFKLS